MQYINLYKVQKYAPGDEQFVSVALHLLKDELFKFKKSIEDYARTNEFKDFRQAIHKIKPSCELFAFPLAFNEKLLEFYDFKEPVTNKDLYLPYFESEVNKILGELHSILENGEKV